MSDPTHIKGADGENIRMKYENRLETWTEKELLIEVLKELRQLREIKIESFVLPKSDPTQRKG